MSRTLMLAAILLMPATAVRANDSAAQLAAGGLMLTTNDAVEMRSEDLYLSPSKVRVRYQFLNTSGRDTTIRVAFPLPVIGGGDYFERDVAIPAAEDDNFLDFSTRVDGRLVKMEIEQRALAGGRERSAWLRANGVPLNPLLGDTAQALARLAPERRQEALATGLLDDMDRPAWTLQTTYHWLQTFQAGVPLVIEHHYTPAVGGTVVTALGGDGGSDPDTVRRYCVEPSLTRALQVARRQGRHFAEQWLDYVLVTGGNWKKPIGRFRLVIDKEDEAALVSFCGTGVRKIGPTQFEMKRTNWRPQQVFPSCS